MLARWRKFFSDHSGTVAVAAALGIVPFLGLMAAASDMGTILTVKHELQNAADAAALAGTRAYAALPGDNLDFTFPDWGRGQSTAQTIVSQHKAEGQSLADAQINAGYYNLTSKTMQSTAITPTAQDVPAMEVIINKQDGKNGGPVKLFFARIFGKNTTDVAARAISIISGPSSIRPGEGFPLAVAQALVQQWWSLNPPVSFRIGSAYHYPDESAGQWTSFLVDANNVPIIRDLIDNGNPTEVKIGDNIWIEPGTKTTLFPYAESKVGQVVMLPVVETDFDTHAWTPVLGFVPFYIEAAVGGDDKYIQGHFVKNYTKTVGDKPSGDAPFYGAATPPKLVD